MNGPTTPPPKGRTGKLIITITLVVAIGGGIVALAMGRRLVEARRARLGLPPVPTQTEAPPR